MKYDIYVNKHTFVGRVEANGEAAAKQMGRAMLKEKGLRGRLIAIQVLKVDPALRARIIREIAA